MIKINTTSSSYSYQNKKTIKENNSIKPLKECPDNEFKSILDKEIKKANWCDKKV